MLSNKICTTLNLDSIQEQGVQCRTQTRPAPIFFATFAQYSPNSVGFLMLKLSKLIPKETFMKLLRFLLKHPKNSKVYCVKVAHFLLCFSQLPFFWLTNNLFDHACHLNQYKILKFKEWFHILQVFFQENVLLATGNRPKSD